MILKLDDDHGRALDVDAPLARGAMEAAHDFFELSLDHLCVAGLDGFFRQVNPSWTRSLGWTAEELMSSPTIAFVHPDDVEMTLAGRERLRLGSSRKRSSTATPARTERIAGWSGGPSRAPSMGWSTPARATSPIESRPSSSWSRLGRPCSTPMPVTSCAP